MPEIIPFNKIFHDQEEQEALFADSLIRLPLYPDLLPDMVQVADRVFSVLARFFNKRQ